MLIIDDKIIDIDILQEEFICNLDACKGACCWEGDYGAPIEVEEIELLEQQIDKILPYLTPEGRAVIEKEGVAEYIPQEKEFGTTLVQGGACSFLTYDDNGIAKCGIEKAHEEGAIDYIKPISCHLYPIRVERVEGNDFWKLEYDRWDICSAACEKGKANGVAIYEFLKTPLIRKYGADFYDQLEDLARHVKESKD